METLANMEKLEPQTKIWRDMVREMAYDIVDIFIHHRGQGVDKDGLLDKISGRVSKLRANYKLANKIQQELKARVLEHSQSRDRYRIVEAAATSTVPPGD